MRVRRMIGILTVTLVVAISTAGVGVSPSP